MSRSDELWNSLLRVVLQFFISLEIIVLRHGEYVRINFVCVTHVHLRNVWKPVNNGELVHFDYYFPVAQSDRMRNKASKVSAMCQKGL
jgi:hypothetical protein